MMNLEREKGFEPSTSTLARGAAKKNRRGNKPFRRNGASGGCLLIPRGSVWRLPSEGCDKGCEARGRR